MAKEHDSARLLRVLEAQGLIRTRTGPGGGAFVNEGHRSARTGASGELLLLHEIGITDIYDLRRALEPVLAAELAGNIAEDEIARLEAVMSTYETPPDTIEEAERQRLAELDFHELSRLVLGEPAPAVPVRVSREPSEGTDHLPAHLPPQDPRSSGVRGATTRRGSSRRSARPDAGAAPRDHARRHMLTAQKIMEQQESVVLKNFLSDAEPGARPPG